ncbi:MAG: clostripain-related cysteine peptidase [Ruthenibacterium sp.]
MDCQHCGKLLPKDAVFCPSCGGTQGGGAPQGKPRKKNRGLLAAVLAGAVLLALLLFIAWALGSEEAEPAGFVAQSSAVQSGGGAGAGIYGTDITGVDFRENYTEILGGGADSWTIMVYMVGADLESESGCATADMQEMLDAELGDHVQVVMQTGGCSAWQNDVMSDGETERWLIDTQGLQQLQNLGTQSMLTPEDLADFVSFAAREYPANRQALILWDHGGGSVYGYGSDEMFPDDVLYLPGIEAALQSANTKFDFIGFDACLMGSMETAYMLEPYADYLIASEELEPGYGWDYTPWLTQLSQNPSVPTVELGAYIVDSFIDGNTRSDTLSVISLREMPHVYEMLNAYMDNAEGALTQNGFRELSAARANAKGFAEGDYDMIDLVDFAKQADYGGANALIAAVDSAVKYRNDCEVSGIHGMSMYFPYKSLDVYGSAKDFFSEFGFGGKCYSFYDDFVNILAGGQERSNGTTLKDMLASVAAAPADYTSEAWYNPAQAESAAADDGLDYAELVIRQQGEEWILPLTDADWERLTSIELQVLLDDGEGYIDLGSDQRFTTDDKDNLVISFDNTWVAIGGQVVPYYAESVTENTDDSTSFTGTVPASLVREGGAAQDINLVLEWSSSSAESGRVTGYRYAQGNSAIGAGGTLGRGLHTLKKGDTVQFACDYYTYDGTYDASYLLGDALIIGDKMPAVTYEDVGTNPVLVSFMLTDLYQNQSWTETVEMA